jgi:hypothetical protein
LSAYHPADDGVDLFNHILRRWRGAEVGGVKVDTQEAAARGQGLELIVVHIFSKGAVGDDDWLLRRLDDIVEGHLRNVGHIEYDVGLDRCMRGFCGPGSCVVWTGQNKWCYQGGGQGP